jgi:hypothetical protein
MTVQYFPRIVQPEAVLDVPISPYFFRIVHYVREVTRWFLSFASKQNKLENVAFNVNINLQSNLLGRYLTVWGKKRKLFRLIVD